MEVVVTAEAISHAKLQSNHHHQQTSIQFFYRPDALPVTQPTVSKHWRSLLDWVVYLFWHRLIRDGASCVNISNNIATVTLSIGLRDYLFSWEGCCVMMKWCRLSIPFRSTSPERVIEIWWKYMGVW